jgi:hypothetical protein
VKAPRFRIAWIMVAVAVAAINFAPIRALNDPGLGGVLLVVGALPVANVLVVGMLIARKRPGSRPFLLGFEVFGALALALYLVAVTYSGSRDGLWDRYLSQVFDPLHPVLQPYGPFASTAIELFVVFVMLVGPQFVFALIGGLLSRRFKVTITRR